MAEAPKKRRSIGKILGITAAVFLLLIIVVYFVGTSAAFLKGFILPKVSKSLGADVTVADASISPFKSVRFQKLKVQTPGQEPIFQAEEIIARYSLMDIIGGKINVDEATVVSPVIKVVQNADGTSNLDAFTKKKEAQPSAAPETKPAQKSEKPPQIDIKNVSLKDATIQQISVTNGTRQVVEIRNLNIKIDQLKNGSSGKFTISSQLRMDAQGTNNQPSSLQAKLAGDFDYALEQNLLPKNAKGKLSLDVDNATGSFADAAGLGTTVDCDISPTEIKDFALRFTKKGNQLGTVRVSGPFDAAKSEGKLKVEVAQIDKQVLNIVGGPMGMDFGPTKINSQSDIELSKGGKSIVVVGQLLANSFSVTRTNQTTPSVDLQANYNVSADLLNQVATINTFSFTGTQNKQPLLNAKLSKPMTLDWGKGAEGVDESIFALEVTKLKLADWKAFAGEAAQAGQLNLKLDVLSKGAGKDLDTTLTVRLQDYSGQFGSNKVDRADIDVSTKTHITQFDKVNISSLQVDVAQAGQKAASVSASGNYSLQEKTGDIQATINAVLSQLGRLVGQPELAKSGQFNAKVKVSAQDKGNKLSPDVTAKITDFSGNVGGNRIDRAGVDINLRATVLNNDTIDIAEAKINVTQADQPTANVSASGGYGMKSQDADLKATVDAALPKLSQLLNNPDLAIDSGMFKFNGTVQQKGAAQTIAGDLLVDRFTGHYSNYRFNEFIAAIQTDIEKQKDMVQIRKLNGDLKEGTAPGGSFSVSGNIDIQKMAGQVAVNLKDLNEHTLRTFLQPSLGDKKLLSVLISGNATAQLQSATDYSTKASFIVTNLVVQDPKKNKPESPLSVQLTADAAGKDNVFDLRQVAVGLTPTERGKNQLQIKGLVDTSKSNALKGNITITADSIDITKYYDLYAGEAQKEKAKAAPASGQRTAAAPAAKDENKEPDAIKLPIQEFALNINIGQFYLREIAVTNIQSIGKIVGSKINLNPVQLTVNGAPVKASVDADVGVPGFVYNVGLTADRIPLEPIANSFIPDKRGQYKGEILANIQVKGAGMTGVNLKKNLEGQVGFSFTNANIAVAPTGWIGGVLKVVAIALRVPSLLDSPLNYVDAHIDLGNGQINLKNGDVVSPAFKASTAGIIPIANILTNSPLNKLPVDFYLSHSLAQSADLLPANTPANAQYVMLPNFIKLVGTLGKPDADIDKLALGGILGKSLGKFVPGTAGNVLKGVGGLFGGQTAAPATTNAAPAQGTNQNQPATVNPVKSANDIINLFKKKK